MGKIRNMTVAAVMCAVMLFLTGVHTTGLTTAQKNAINNKISNYQAENRKLANEIAKLKKEKNQQSAILDALQKKIANTQSIINAYNAEIDRINGVIAENKNTITAKQAEIEQDKLDYKKRLRAIYMSNWDSDLKILLGAKTFTEYLELSQLTDAVSQNDKKLIDRLKSEIEQLNVIIEENNKLLSEQVELKEEIKKQQDELKEQQAEATAIYNEINKQVSADTKEISANEAEIAKLKKQLEAEVTKKGNAASTFINPNTGFMWPVAGYYGISSPFGQRRSGFHSGMDISGGGISGRPILAIADGEVYMVNKSWTPSQGRSGYASYGNFCAINHGTMTIKGSSAKYVAFYAHATSIIVSVGQKVKQGQVLGYVGTTGNSTGPHLHIGIQKNGSWVNPYPLLRG
ncbi:MAG: peptidoglycan DD-metalloendopeptidase family protein [Clostridia bacterium]|nr:peptidoglycan DD-metalloendopeptidase family protein [Clostridia bacterium]